MRLKGKKYNHQNLRQRVLQGAIRSDYLSSGLLLSGHGHVEGIDCRVLRAVGAAHGKNAPMVGRGLLIL